VGFLLRKLDKRTRWNKEEVMRKFSWLQNEITADCITKELETNDCALSFWMIDDQKSNLERVIAALAANRPNLAEVDFGLIDIQLLIDSGFNIDTNPGDTADDAANNWHRDVSQLSGKKLNQLGELLWEHMQSYRKSRKDILAYIVSGIINGHLDRNKIKTESPELINQIDRL